MIKILFTIKKIIKRIVKQIYLIIILVFSVQIIKSVRLMLPKDFLILEEEIIKKMLKVYAKNELMVIKC